MDIDINWANENKMIINETKLQNMASMYYCYNK